MGFRITTSMMLNSYQYNLQGSTKRLSDARDMVLTQRKFSSYAEDPAAATLSFRLRRSYLQTSSYLANTKDVYSKFNTAWHNLTGVIEDLSDATARVASIRGNNGPSGESRRALAIDLRETANSLVQALNQKLGDHFIFAGNDALNPPFSWSEDGRTLYYRGVDVTGGWMDPPTTRSAPDWFKTDAKTGEITTLPNEVPTLEKIDNDTELSEADKAWEKAWINYYWDQKKSVAYPRTYIPSWASDTQFFNKDGTLKKAVDENGDPLVGEDGQPTGELLIEKWLRENSAVGEDGEQVGISSIDQAWIKYYDETGGNLTELPEPDWFKTGRDMPDYNKASDYEKAWIDYYNYLNNPAPNPAKYRPEWADQDEFFNKDGSLNETALRKWFAGAHKELTSDDEAWIEYYKYITNDRAKPPTTRAVPEWYKTGVDVPGSSAACVDAYERAWLKYYNYKNTLESMKPDDSVPVPDWAEKKGQFINDNGTLKKVVDEDGKPTSKYVIEEWLEKNGGMSSGDREWINYYKYKENAVPDPATYRPDWRTNDNYFNSDGSVNEAALKERLGNPLSDADQAWVDYYNYRSDPRATKPTERPQPEWFKTGTYKDEYGIERPMPSYGKDKYEQAWIDYYNYLNKPAPDPSTYKPEWADSEDYFNLDGSLKTRIKIIKVEKKDEKGDVVKDKDGNPVLEDKEIEVYVIDEAGLEMTAADRAWVDYYKKAEGLRNPVETGAPEWYQKGEEPPANAANDPYGQAWIDYYNYKKEMEGKEPVPNPATDKPEWAEIDRLFEEDGKLNEEELNAWLKIKGKLGDNDEVSPFDQVWIDYYNELYDAQAALRDLKKMSGEEMYIDLGMGAAESAPNVPVRGTYFNSALCGIDFLGFGRDEDGDPLNLALIMKELADVFETWDEDTQSYNPDLAQGTAAGLSSDELEAKAYRLMDKLKAAQEHTTEKWIELDAKSVYLQTSESRLSIQMTDINMQILDIEQVDLAEAITVFSWEQYCYNAALKIGNQLLSQSLIDYMN